MGNLRQSMTDEEWDELSNKNLKANPLNFSTKVEEDGEYITKTTLNSDMSLTMTKELKESARNKGLLGSEVGAKYSNDKPTMGIMLRQFPLALHGVAERSLYGHNKYKEFDHDWMNFKRAPDAINQYLNAAVRHLAEIGDEEDSLEHLKAAAWNILATLQITLEQNNE